MLNKLFYIWTVDSLGEGGCLTDSGSMLALGCVLHTICEWVFWIICRHVILIIITRDLHCAANCRSKIRGAGHCTLAKRMTSILRHVAEALLPATQGTILNSHWVIGIATNTSMVLNCALVTYIMMTADVRLPNAVLRHPQDIIM